MKTMTYEEVTAEVARRLRVNDPLKIRLTQHNAHAHLPLRKAIKYKGIDTLDAMIRHSNQYTNILYYEILHMQLPVLEGMKYMKVCFHNQRAELQSQHRIRLHRDKKIGDLVKQLKIELGDDYAMCDIRVMQILSSKVFKACISSSLFARDSPEMTSRFWTTGRLWICCMNRSGHSAPR